MSSSVSSDQASSANKKFESSSDFVPSNGLDEETSGRSRSARKITHDLDIPTIVPSDTSDEEPFIRRHRAARNTAAHRSIPAQVVSRTQDKEPPARRRLKRKITVESDTPRFKTSETSDEETSKSRRRSKRIRPSGDYRAHTPDFIEDILETFDPEECVDHESSSDFEPSATESTSHDKTSVNIPSDDSDEEPIILRRHRRDLDTSSISVDSTQDLSLEQPQVSGPGSNSSIDRTSTSSPTPNGDSSEDGDPPELEHDSNATTPVSHIHGAPDHTSSPPRPLLLAILPPQVFELIQLIPPESTVRSHKPPYMLESVRQKIIRFCNVILSSVTLDRIAGLLTLMPEDVLHALAWTIEFIVLRCSIAEPGLYALENLLEGQCRYIRVIRWFQSHSDVELAAAMGIQVTRHELIRLLMKRVVLAARPRFSREFAQMLVWGP